MLGGDAENAHLLGFPHGLERREDIEIGIDVAAGKRDGALTAAAEGNVGHVDRGLFGGYLFDRIAKIFLMIDVDTGDGGDLGVGGSRRIEPSAQPRFENGKIDLCFGKSHQSYRRHLFKERRTVFQHPVRKQPIRRLSHPGRV